MFSRLLDAKHQFHGRWRGDTQQIAWGILQVPRGVQSDLSNHSRASLGFSGKYDRQWTGLFLPAMTIHEWWKFTQTSRQVFRAEVGMQEGTIPSRLIFSSHCRGYL